jgi:hypothetical protein
MSVAVRSGMSALRAAWASHSERLPYRSVSAWNVSCGGSK